MKSPEQQQQTLRSMEAAALQATENMKRDLTSAEEMGQHASMELHSQARQIVSIDKNLSKIETGLQGADDIVKQMKLFRSPFGFSDKAAKYAYIFQSKHGGPAEWSGPLKERYSYLPIYRQRFAALADHVLYLYKDAAHLVNETNIVDIRDAKVREIQTKLKIVIHTSQGAKVVLKCANENDYKGWSYVLKAKAEKRPNSAISIESAVPQESKLTDLGAFSRPQEEETFQTPDNDLQKLIDSNLDLIGSQVDGLKTRSLELQNQINHQDHLVDGLNTSVEKVSAKLDQSMTLMRKHA